MTNLNERLKRLEASCGDDNVHEYPERNARMESFRNHVRAEAERRNYALDRLSLAECLAEMSGCTLHELKAEMRGGSFNQFLQDRWT